MSQLSFRRPRQTPLVMLSLLLNMLLLGGSILYLSMAGGGAALLLNGSSQRQHRRSPSAAGFAACERPELDTEKLEEWGCKVFNKACFDEGRTLLLHSGEKTPDSPLFVHDELFKTGNYPSFVLPNGPEPLGTPHYNPPTWALNIRGPTPYDPPDVWQPDGFSNCTVPLVWWLSYFSVFGDLYINSALALDMMMAAGAFDRNVTLAPVTLGMDVMPWYQNLLEPYTRHKVVSLSSLSSREHIHTGQPRCFERAVLCNLVGLYGSGGSARHDWGQLRPKTTGRRAVEYYRKTYPERFSLHERLAAAENGTVFRVAFMPRAKLRAIVNLGEAVQECNKWVPPADTRFKETRCEILPDGTPDNFVDLLARFQNVHALVAPHGSQNNFAFFMPNGTALVEIIPWNFHGKGCTWVDQYFADWFTLDHTVHSGYFRLVSDKKHTFPGPYEKEGKGSTIAWGRDQDVALDVPTLAKALTKIARGELESNSDNHAERTFFMTAKDICPAAEEYQAKVAEAKAKAAAEQQEGGPAETAET